jgi:predicted aspartyl protease
VKLKAYLGVAVFFVTALPSQAEITGEPQRSPLARHFVCDKGYTLKQCDEELMVLKKALAKYPIPDLGEWTWVLVRSEYWKLSLTTQTLNPGIPALTDAAAKATFFDDALVTGASGRMSELMALWHMGRESLLDFAIRHELGHAFCNNANEMDAERVARLLEQKKPITCKAKVKASVYRAASEDGIVRSGMKSAPTPTVNPTMPFELVSGFLVVVDGQIGNVDGLKFILDTGATHSLIDRKVADRLHLKRRSGEVISFDHYIPVEWAIIPELRVGPLRTETLRVMVVKLAEYSDPAEHADGIIGLDLLSQSKKFTIDYEKRTVSLQLAEVGTTGRSSSPCFVIPLVVQGLQVNLAVDTGLQGIVLYKNRLRKGLPKMRIEGESTNVVMGRLRGTQVRLPGVRIVDAEVVSTAILIDGPDDKTLPGVDGYLGPATLQAKRIEFDFDAKVLRWQ